MKSMIRFILPCCSFKKEPEVVFPSQDITYKTSVLSQSENKKETDDFTQKSTGNFEEEGQLVLDFECAYSGHIPEDFGQPKLLLKAYQSDPRNQQENWDYTTPHQLLAPRSFEKDFEMGVQIYKTKEYGADKPITFYKGYIKSLRNTKLTTKEEETEEIRKLRRYLYIEGEKIDSMEFQFNLYLPMKNKNGSIYHFCYTPEIFYFRRGASRNEIKLVRGFRDLYLLSSKKDKDS